MENFSEWLDKINPVAILKKAAKIAHWSILHPTKVPSRVSRALRDEWHHLVKEYGYTQAAIIIASLVIALGPGMAVPGSISLFWITIGVCNLYNIIVDKVKSDTDVGISKEQVDQEVVRIKGDLLKRAKTGLTSQEH